MLSLPSHVLEKLRCAQCTGYLSCGPIVINRKNEQLCGRCFKIFPDESKAEYVRQIGLEAVAQIVNFPCKYNERGCTYTFPWNNGHDHELNCEHRYKTLSLERSYKSDSSSKEIDIKVNCDSVSNHNLEDQVKLNLNLTGKNGNKLSLINEQTHQSKNIRLGVEITLSVDTAPQVVRSRVSVENDEESFYESISIFSGNCCTNCQTNILNCEIYSCAFGHTFCKKCKKSICKICGFQLNSNLLQYCKNYASGCTQLFPVSDIKKHEIDCEFNNFNCPLCDFVNNLNILVSHFTQNHNAVYSNELNATVSNRDETWFFYCYDKLFSCKYYYLNDNIEFVVSYIGSNDEACNFKYKIKLTTSTLKVFTKQAKCLGWNETSLGKAVTFDLTNNMKKEFQVFVSILSIA